MMMFLCFSGEFLGMGERMEVEWEFWYYKPAPPLPRQTANFGRGRRGGETLFYNIVAG